MKLSLVSAPAVLPVTTQEVMDFARIDIDPGGSLFANLISAAVQNIDGRDGLLGRALITQTWRATWDGFPRTGPIILPLPPCQSVASITYLDTFGTLQTLPTSVYRVVGLGTPDGAMIEPTIGNSWPDTASLLDCLTITFTAGYGDTSASIPEPIRTAIKIHFACLHEGRESPDLPPAFFSILTPYRTWAY